MGLLKRVPPALTTLAALLVVSCAGPATREFPPPASNEKYTSAFPSLDCSAQLGEIGESVKMVNSVAYYRTYSFREGENIRTADITPELLRSREKESVVTSNQASGTATILDYDDRRVVLLTCAHVVAFSDSSRLFFVGPNHRSTGYLRNFALKQRQTNYVAVFPEGGELDILAIDRSLDVALLGKTFDVEPFPRPRRFAYPAGSARDLDWGSFIYLFGYPTGFKMVTKAIVSSPNRDRHGGFLVDAVIAPGSSGAIALALRGGVPHFEFVGIVKLVSGHSEYYLTPGDMEGDYDPITPYAGDLYVERRTEIEYGIAQAVPVESIREFINAHRSDLAARGYTVRFPAEPSTPP